MQPDTKTQTPVKKPSKRASITGGVLAVIGWALAGIGSLLIHADYRSDQPLTSTAEKVDDAVASGTLHVFSVFVGVPFLVGGIVLGILAIIFTLIRLRKARSAGLVLSVVWLILAAWALQLSIAAFDTIKAH